MGPPQDWREAAEAAFAGLSGYIHELNTDVGLYRAVRRTMDDSKVVVRTCGCDSIHTGSMSSVVFTHPESLASVPGGMPRDRHCPSIHI